MTPGEELIDLLDDLRINLNQLVQKLEKSGVERTKGLRDLMGSDCSFYRKSLSLFEKRDYVELRNLVQACHNQFQLIEGKRDDR